MINFYARNIIQIGKQLRKRQTHTMQPRIESFVQNHRIRNEDMALMMSLARYSSCFSSLLFVTVLHLGIHCCSMILLLLLLANAAVDIAVVRLIS